MKLLLFRDVKKFERDTNEQGQTNKTEGKSAMGNK